MIAFIILWFVVIIGEAFRNWYLIEREKIEINHAKQVVIRCAVAIPLWMATPIFFEPHIPIESFWWQPGMMALTFWFHFDILLNVMRKKPFWYFGQGSWLDRQQAKWPLPWIWFKFLLAYASITIWFKGLDII